MKARHADEAEGNAACRLALHDLHIRLGAKMVPFAGYEMPLQYRMGIINEHRHVRTEAGLFDVSHMGQVNCSGPAAATFLEKLAPVDLVDLPIGAQRYAFFTNRDGGILDDLIVTKVESNKFRLVLNAARKESDVRHLEEHVLPGCEIAEMHEFALLALQGPEAASVIRRLAPQAATIPFMCCKNVKIGVVECLVSRCGYTGEDGFEISVAERHAEEVATLLLSDPHVAPIGLGARDSLRLEAALCLYGNDIDTTTSPVDAGLYWAVAKARRPDGARPGGYLGSEVLSVQLRNGVSRRRVGFAVLDKIPVRQGAEIFGTSGVSVGRVTSGGFSPTLGYPIGMGYVEAAAAIAGAKLNAAVRDRRVPIQVVGMPFIEHRYFREHAR